MLQEGPTVAAYRGLGDDPARIAALDADIDELANDALSASTIEWMYVVVVARRR